MAGGCNRGNKSSGFVKGGEFFFLYDERLFAGYLDLKREARREFQFRWKIIFEGSHSEIEMGG